MIADVRRFNRVVTQRVGALEDRFLATGRPLGEARVLWEIGDGCEVRALRERLGLDSGYASRLLRALEAAGLVEVAPSERDRRVRVARLTKAGARERAILDRRSDELAASFLEPLRPAQRERLVAAMGEVERLLTASLVQVAEEDPDTAAARHCLREYARELDRRFSGGFDPARSVLPDPSVLRPPRGLLVLARLHGDPVGCGALVFHDGYAEIKRMWVSPDARGLGLGRRLLDELEARAGTPLVRLDTNGALTEAIAMYRSAGYREIPRYNDEVHAQHWFEKAV
jgi:DNA-binding MarR family transcriptional regulator/ribosomal protein S18 acetylase RimI-like enzyme